MSLPTVLFTAIFLLYFTGTCVGQVTAGDEPPMNGVPPTQETRVGEPNTPPEGTVLPFVPSYGFDLLDIGRTIEEKLSLQVSGTLQSKHIWHGFDLMSGHSVFFPVATMTVADTGFSAKVIGACAIGGEVSQRDELDGALFYSRDLLPNARYATHCTLDYFYYGKPRIPSQRADAQELGLSLSWPKLLGDNSLVPSYYVGGLWPSEHDSPVSGISGFIHVLGLAYNLAVPNPGSQDHTQFFKLYGDLTFNDGFGGAGHGWSHTTFGTSTDLAAGKVIITPAINYQISMKDSITPESGFWGGMTFTYRS
jgi:hypothetical protein